MKKLSIIIALSLIFSLVGNLFGEYRADKPSGEGTKESPYLMESLENLLWLSDNVTNVVSGSYFLQTKDIDAGETKGWRDGKGFPPIGICDYKNYSTGSSNVRFFNGTYDGDNHVIYGLNFAIYQPDVCCGLFGGVTNSVLKNIVLDDVTMDASSFTCAGLAAYVVRTSISNCHVSITFTQKGDESSGIGGLVGFIEKFAEIDCCSAKVNNLKGGNLGGLVGGCEGGLTVLDQESISIRKCFTEGNIYGDVIGGIIGDASAYKIVMEDCYSWAGISKRYLPAGGITAYGAAGCKNCYYFGKIENANPISGEPSQSACSGVYYCSEQGSDPSPGTIGKTYAELLKKETYEGWDFENTWYIEEDVSLPTLSWEMPEPCFASLFALILGMFMMKRNV